MWEKKGIIFNKHHAQLPVVDVYPETYRIYYSTRNENGCSLPMCLDINKNDFSIVNKPKHPILKLGKPGSFDHYGIMPTDIITLEKGIKYLYYIGWSRRLDVPYHNSTGLAISKDGGVTWEKYSEGPIFNTSAKEPGFIGTVCVFNSPTWRMYYSSSHWEEINGKLEPVYDIKSAISNDGINWDPTKKSVILLIKEEGGICALRKIKNKLYYSVRNKTDYRINSKHSYKIKSYDLNTNEETLELDTLKGELMTAYPYIIDDKNRLLMFYNTDFGQSGIFLAIKDK